MKGKNDINPECNWDGAASKYLQGQVGDRLQKNLSALP